LSEDGNLSGDFDVLGSDALVIKPRSSGDRVTISGGDRNRVIQHLGTGLLSLENLTVTRGRENASGFESGFGGGVYSDGPLQLSGVTVFDNSSGIAGGGVYASGGLEAVNSTFTQNSSGGSGGGIKVAGSELSTMRSITIARNSAATGGAGLSVDSVSSNESIPAIVRLSNVLLADNTGTNECEADEYLEARLLMTTAKLGPRVDCIESGPDDNIVRISDSGLGTLDTNGQTPTLELEPGSPAIRTGNVGGELGCPSVDQLGHSRRRDSCDIGALRFSGSFPFRSLRLSGPKRMQPLGNKRSLYVAKLKTLFSGSGQATNGLLCLKPGAWKKVVRVRGKLCRQLPKLDKDISKVTAFKFVRKSALKNRPTTVRFSLSAPRFEKRVIRTRLKRP